MAKPQNPIKSTRLALGLSVEGMARAIGVSHDSMARYEAGSPPGPVALIIEAAQTIPAFADMIRERGQTAPRGRPRKNGEKPARQ